MENASEVTEAALDMRVTKAGHDKIPLARIERRSRSLGEDEDNCSSRSTNGNESNYFCHIRCKLIKRYYHQTGLFKQATFYRKFASRVINFNDNFFNL